jgi:hypothetical protein
MPDGLAEIEETLAAWNAEPVHQPDFEWRKELEWLIAEVKGLRALDDSRNRFTNELLRNN